MWGCERLYLGRRFKIVPLWWGGVLNLGRCVEGTEGGSSMAVSGFGYGCGRRFKLMPLCGAMCLNLDRGGHLGGGIFLVVVSNINYILSLII